MLGHASAAMTLDVYAGLFGAIWMPSPIVSTSWLLGQLRTQCGLGGPDKRRRRSRGGNDGAAGLRKRLVPLIGQLSNLHFGTNLDELTTESSQSVPVRARTATRSCSCGCGQPVAEHRKFVNQDHYSAWLSRTRYFGRNRDRQTSRPSCGTSPRG